MCHLVGTAAEGCARIGSRDRGPAPLPDGRIRQAGEPPPGWAL